MDQVMRTKISNGRTVCLKFVSGRVFAIEVDGRAERWSRNHAEAVQMFEDYVAKEK